MKNRRRKRKTVKAGKIWLLVFLIGAGVFLGYRLFFSRPPGFSGVAYLEKLEAANIENLAKQINTQKKERMLAAIESGEVDPFSYFEDSVFLGDSRVYGFWSYGFFPQERTFAEGGYTIANISEYLDSIEQLKPEYILCSYGVNDMGLEIGSELGEDGYGKFYEAQINEVLKRSPNSKIVLNSIIEPTPDVVAANPRWGYSADLNRQIKEICKKNGWIYVDNSELSQGGTADIYSEDGLHFQGTFYPVWVNNMLQTILETEDKA